MESLLHHSTLRQAIPAPVAIQIVANQATPEDSLRAPVQISEKELKVLTRAQESRNPDTPLYVILDREQVNRAMPILLAASFSDKGDPTIQRDNTQALGRVMSEVRTLVERSNIPEASILEVHLGALQVLREVLRAHLPRLDLRPACFHRCLRDQVAANRSRSLLDPYT